MYKLRNIDIDIHLGIVICILAILIILCYRLSNKTMNIAMLESFNNQTISVVDNPDKIAFLFLTRNNLKRPEIWESFLKGNESRYTIYCHPKEPEKVSDALLKPNIIPENIETCWGCIGTVEANIVLMQNALLDSKNKHFILVSESCIPIASFNNIYNKLTDKTYISVFQEHLDRYDSCSNKIFPKSEFTKHCAQGIIFNRNHAKSLVDTKTKYLDDWKNVHCVDEHYFSNILRILDNNFNNNIINCKITFDLWSKNKLDKSLYIDNDDITNDSYNTIFSMSNKFINLLRANDYLFARKVNENTKVDINYILA
jgi:hypothetical protein